MEGVRPRGKGYEARKRIPDCLKAKFGKREFKKGLGTKDIRSFLPSGKFDVEHIELYDELVTPRMVETLAREYGADDARNLLEYIAEHVEQRRAKAQNGLNRYSLGCYAAWLRDVIARIRFENRGSIIDS